MKFIFFILIICIQNVAGACEDIRLSAEYSHHSSLLSGKPFYIEPEDTLITNTWSAILTIPFKYIEFDLGLGFESKNLYGKEPTGTFRVRVPIYKW